MLNLESMSLADLKLLAKEHNIKNISKLKKDELVAMLTQILKETEENEVEVEEENLKEDDVESFVEKEPVERRYDKNGEPIIDYKLTNEGDEIVEGILDILPDGYGFLRGDNFLSSEKDVYISMVQIRRFKLDTGDIVKGISRFKEGEKFPSLIFVGLNLLITIAIPVVFFIYLRKHAKLDLKGILVGGLVYIFMNQIMLNLVGILILMIPGVQAYMQANMFVSQSISVILSVAMEFLAILLGMMWMRRRQLTFNDCVMFLLGYSCIIILTETIAQSLAMLINCIMINTQGLTAIFAQIPDTDVDMAVQAYQSVLSAHPVEFLID